MEPANPPEQDETTIPQLMYSGQDRSQSNESVHTGARQSIHINRPTGYGDSEIFAKPGSASHSFPTFPPSYRRAVPVWEEHRMDRPQEDLGVWTHKTTGRRFSIKCDAMPLPNAQYKPTHGLSDEKIRGMGHGERVHMRTSVEAIEPTVDRTFDMVDRVSDTMRHERAGVRIGLGKNGDLPDDTRLVDEVEASTQCGYLDTRPYEEQIVIPGPTNRDQTTKLSYTAGGTWMAPAGRKTTRIDAIERPDEHTPSVGIPHSFVDATAVKPILYKYNRVSDEGRTGGISGPDFANEHAIRAPHAWDSSMTRRNERQGYNGGPDGDRSTSVHVDSGVDRSLMGRDGFKDVSGSIYPHGGTDAIRPLGSSDATTTRTSSQSAHGTSSRLDAQRRTGGQTIEARKVAGASELKGRTALESTQSYAGGDTSTQHRSAQGFSRMYQNHRNYETPEQLHSNEYAGVNAGLGVHSTTGSDLRQQRIMESNTDRDAGFRAPNIGEQTDHVFSGRAGFAAHGFDRSTKNRTPRRARETNVQDGHLPGITMQTETNSSRSAQVTQGQYGHDHVRPTVSVR